MTEADILRVMEGLHCSREEAIEILRDDEAVDRGENLFELTPEQKKASKEARSAGGNKRTKPAQRERKVDEAKGAILTACQTTLAGLNATVTKVQTETEIEFTLNGENYTLKLTKHRPPKT